MLLAGLNKLTDHTERQKDKSKIFGVSLCDLSRAARVPCGEHGDMIPGVVFSILETLQSDPSTYTETGIFRTAGPASRVEQLVQIIDEGTDYWPMAISN